MLEIIYEMKGDVPHGVHSVRLIWMPERVNLRGLQIRTVKKAQEVNV